MNKYVPELLPDSAAAVEKAGSIRIGTDGFDCFLDADDKIICGQITFLFVPFKSVFVLLSCDGVEEVRIRHLFSFFAYTLQPFIHLRWADHIASLQIMVNSSVHLGF